MMMTNQSANAFTKKVIPSNTSHPHSWNVIQLKLESIFLFVASTSATALKVRHSPTPEALFNRLRSWKLFRQSNILDFVENKDLLLFLWRHLVLQKLLGRDGNSG